MTAAITFAVPFYSAPEFLRPCIESALRQTRADWELVVVDNKSAHDVQPLIASFADPRIRYHRSDEHVSMAENWNRALGLARTPLVTLLHADDELLPNYAETMLPLLAKHPDASAAFCAAQIIDGHGQPRASLVDFYKAVIAPRAEPFVLAGQAGLRVMLRGNIIMCPTLCFRMTRLPLRFGDTWPIIADMDLTTRLLLNGHSLVGTHTRAFRYRRHAASGTTQGQKNLRMFEEEIALFDALAHEADARGWRDAAAAARAKHVLRARVAVAAAADLARRDLAGARNKARLWASRFLSL